MNERIDSHTALEIQMQYLWQDRALALATLLEGKARDEFRMHVQIEEMWEEYALEKARPRSAEWRLHECTVQTRKRIREEMEQLEAIDVNNSSEHLWDDLERSMEVITLSLHAHLAVASILRSRAILADGADPILIVEVAEHFASSHDSTKFFHEQSNIFLSKINIDAWNPDDYINEELRNAVLQELSTVLHRVRAVAAAAPQTDSGA